MWAHALGMPSRPKVIRAVVSDSSGCGSILVGNNTQGGFVFEIDDPTQLEIKDIEFDDKN